MPEAAQDGNRQGLEEVMTKSHELALLEKQAAVTLSAARGRNADFLRSVQVGGGFLQPVHDRLHEGSTHRGCGVGDVICVVDRQRYLAELHQLALVDLVAHKD